MSWCDFWTHPAQLYGADVSRVVVVEEDMELKLQSRHGVQGLQAPKPHVIL